MEKSTEKIIFAEQNAELATLRSSKGANQTKKTQSWDFFNQ